VTDPHLRIPFLRPIPPRLSDQPEELRAIEDSGVFTNFGPCHAAFEEEVISALFDGAGHVVPMCNATVALILAMKAMGRKPDGRRHRLALIPSFCFAATAHAAQWAGYQPHFYDVDSETWLPDARSERELISKRGNEIGLIVPYATFGAALDLSRFEHYLDDFGIPSVVDAAASLGTRNADGSGYGSGSRLPIVYSMHATKTFATAEGGLIYTSDPALADHLRDMANFGFGSPREATMPGLNAKLSEIGALLARKRLVGFDKIVDRRGDLVERYRSRLPRLTYQRPLGAVQAHQFAAFMLSRTDGVRRDNLLDQLRAAGIGSAKYFSPHLRDHPHFAATCSSSPLPNSDDLAARTVCLPLFDDMTFDEVDVVCDAVIGALAS
jgi:dTDP-4-amino-4,6-dideoxygalactose transaminase